MSRLSEIQQMPELLQNPQERFRNRNVVLFRTEVGQVKKSQYNLPNLNHVYGKMLKKDAEGGKEVIFNWKFHEHSQPRPEGPDFKQMNRVMIQNRIVNPKDISRYIRN